MHAPAKAQKAGQQAYVSCSISYMIGQSSPFEPAKAQRRQGKLASSQVSLTKANRERDAEHARELSGRLQSAPPIVHTLKAVPRLPRGFDGD